jgi:hypothetical protein
MQVGDRARTCARHRRKNRWILSRTPNGQGEQKKTSSFHLRPSASPDRPCPLANGSSNCSRSTERGREVARLSPMGTCVDRPRRYLSSSVSPENFSVPKRFMNEVAKGFSKPPNFSGSKHFVDSHEYNWTSLNPGNL